VAKYTASLRGDGAKQGPYDLVLMDYSMPEMDGTEAVQLMRSEWRPGDHKTTFVCVTAYPEDSPFKKVAIDAGFDIFLAKPVHQKSLEELIGEYFCFEESI